MRKAQRGIFAWTALLGLVLLGRAVSAVACPAVGFTLVEPGATAQTQPMRIGPHRTIYVRRALLTTASDIAAIHWVSDGGDDATLLIKFTPAADQRMHEVTTNHPGLRLAFLFDDEVLLNVVWQGPYGMDLGGSQVSLRHGMKKARRLVAAMQGCTAPPAEPTHAQRPVAGR